MPSPNLPPPPSAATDPSMRRVELDPEWGATEYLLAQVARSRPDVLDHVHPERHSIAWDVIFDSLWPTMSSGERILVDVAYALWTGRSAAYVRWRGADEDEEQRQLAGIGDVFSRLDDDGFAAVLEALRIRRGMALAVSS